MSSSIENPTREKLIETAMELFYQQGFSATGLKQILGASGVHSGSLYHFFKSKEELLLAVLERYHALLRPVLIDPIWSQVDDPLERVFALLEGYRAGLEQTGCTAGCPIGNLALELNEFHPDAHALIADNFRGWREAVAGCLEEAGDRLPRDLDRAQLACFVLTTMEGAVMQARSFRSLEPFDQSVSTLRDYFARLEEQARRGSEDDPR